MIIEAASVITAIATGVAGIYTMKKWRGEAMDRMPDLIVGSVMAKSDVVMVDLYLHSADKAVHSIILSSPGNLVGLSGQANDWGGGREPCPADHFSTSIEVEVDLFPRRVSASKRCVSLSVKVRNDKKSFRIVAQRSISRFAVKASTHAITIKETA